MPPILQGHRIRAGIGVGQGSCAHGSPGPAQIGGGYLEKAALPGAAHREERLPTGEQNAGLDGAELCPIVYGASAGPSAPLVRAALKMHPPDTGVGGRFRTGRSQPGPVGQNNRFVFYWTDQRSRQTTGRAPGASIVLAGLLHAPPCLRGGSRLVEQDQRSSRRLEKHWIPARHPFPLWLIAIGHFHWDLPFSLLLARNIDRHIRMFFLRAPKPCCHQPTRSFRYGRSMAARKRGGGVDEIRRNHARLGFRRVNQPGKAEEEKSNRFHEGV